MQTPLQLEIWLQSYKGFDNGKQQYKTKELEHSFCQYLKTNIADIRLIPLDHVTYEDLIHIISLQTEICRIYVIYRATFL